MQRLGNLASEIGWPVEMLLNREAREIENLLTVNDALQDWRDRQTDKQIESMQNGGQDYPGS